MSRIVGNGEGGRAGDRYGLLSPTAIATILCLLCTGIPVGALGNETSPGLMQPDDGALVTATITFSRVDMMTGATPQQASRPSDVSVAPGAAEFVRLVALPDCRDARVVAVTGLSGNERRALRTSAARVRELVRIREQTIAVVALERDALLDVATVEISIEPIDGTGPRSRPVGPFTGPCRSTVIGYEPGHPELWRAPRRGERRDGATTYCSTPSDCADAGIDFLIIAASDFVYSPALFTLATHHAMYLGLNVGIVSTGDLDALTPEALRSFIQAVYDSESAEHFGDGRLGFVLLLGDAYADDNQTVMVPEYDGYGGQEEASDHYYACVSGDDDFEDVMLGRLSVGNLTELVRVVGKAGNYMPMDEGAEWRQRMLMIGGLFYTTKQEYVDLFDDYDDLIPDEMEVERIYRHDFQNDAHCASAVVDAINDGHLFTTFVGDGWIHEWHRTMNSSHIAGLENSDRLPIVLSMACMTGWFDNTTQMGPTGSYDCFAEELVNADNSGAIACFAAPRPTDGGVYRSLAMDVYRAAFEEHCVYLGELFATAKLMHLQNGGDVNYVRHFNLFGDPALIFAWDETPTSGADLVLRPHELSVVPEYPCETDELTVTVTVTNQSSVAAEAVTLRLEAGGPDGGHVEETIVSSLPGWSETTQVFTLPASSAGSCSLSVVVDPYDEIEEIDEGNNSLSRSYFVYASLPGFPIEIEGGAYTPLVTTAPDRSPAIVVQGGDARVWSIAVDGSISWQTDAALEPLDYGPELATAAGDLDGDGETETAAIKRMAAMAFESDGTPMWTMTLGDPIGRPTIADMDGDGDGDVVVTTWNLFGGQSMIVAIDEEGDALWTWTVPGAERVSTAPVAGDLDLDGRPEIAFGTEEGGVYVLTSPTGTPEELWPGAQYPGGQIHTLALVDADRDGSLELLVGCDRIVALSSADGAEGWSFTLDSAIVSLAAGNLDADDTIEIVAASQNGVLYRFDGGVPTWGVTIDGAVRESFVIADVDGDASREIVLTTADGRVITVEPDGSIEKETIPIPGGAHTPFVADVDGDGAIELCVSSDAGFVFLLDLDGSAGSVAWSGLGARATRTGLLAQPFSGEITGNVVLSGDYSITENLTVAEGGALTLTPGTELSFESAAAGLIIYGGLDAEGTDHQPIVLGCSDDRSEWPGMVLYAGATVDLTNCLIEDATFGMRGQQASVTLASVETTDGLFGVDLSRSSFSATDCVFSGADSAGVRLTTSSTGTIRNCSVTGTIGRGIEIRNRTSCRVVSTTITGVAEGHGIACTKYSDAIIDSCTITDSGGHGILASASAPKITGCVITGNGGSGVQCVKVAGPHITRSTITDNNMGVVVEHASTAVLGSNMYPDTGYNSIHGNTRAAVANYNGTESPVYARWNWWGSANPYGRLFVGHVVHNPWLDAPPDERPSLVYGDELPSSLALHPNTPNPFNPSTSLELEIPAGGADVDVAVYDVSGRRVAVLHSGHLEAGRHSLLWTGADERGNTVASGVYFARMVAPGYKHSVRMLLLK